ncbi:MAG: hypothetical protein A2V66_07830 [Ignavibacteria bacterium RBG_13_36_8]|nr:MAG: hypothetical protein A2V66_07830 [Ignavibacteria bacterium RBG_13_36_8]
MFEFFIAKRYLKSKHTINFITIISILSTIGITIGVAALVVVLSVFNGFGSLVTSILVNFDPHIRVTVTSDDGYSQIDAFQKKLSTTDMVQSYYPFVDGKVILLNNKTYEILNLKGVTEHKKDESWGVNTKILSGSFNIFSEEEPDKIVLGLPIALRLSCRIGDTIQVTSANQIEKTITNFAIPSSKRFIVAGIFESNNKDYDLSYAFTSLESGQNILGLRGRITGYEIRLTNIDYSNEVKESLIAEFGTDNFSIDTWYDLHKDLYSVMLVERWSAYIILCLIIAVATFNILGSLTMSVVEKRKEIGVLRSMGTNDKSILQIFMFEGILIGIIGTVIGCLIGLFVCYLQIKYNFYPLDPTKYIIEALPIEIRISDIIVISGMSMLLSFLASLYPAKRAVKTEIIDAIKWE